MGSFERDEDYKPYLRIPGNPDERVVFPDELEHHGVKGMKWGVWNDETTERYLGGGSDEYGSDDSSSKTSSRNREEDYELLYELSQGDIQDFEETGKISHWSSKSGMEYYDTIPTERLTLGTDTTFTSYGGQDKNLDGPLYATFKEEEKNTYKGFGDTKYEFSPKRDFEVASMKDSYDTFTELFSEDNDSGQAFREDVYMRQLGPLGTKEKAEVYASAAKSYPEAAASVSYKNFVDNQYRQNSATMSFFNKMEEKGFDGILDQHDIDDYTKNSPVIVLNPLESLELKNRI